MQNAIVLYIYYPSPIFGMVDQRPFSTPPLEIIIFALVLHVFFPKKTQHPKCPQLLSITPCPLDWQINVLFQGISRILSLAQKLIKMPCVSAGEASMSGKVVFNKILRTPKASSL